MLLHFFLATALVSGGVQAVPPASEATVDAFVAAIPPQKPEPPRGHGFERWLEELNPGRDNDIRSIVSTYEECIDATRQRYLIEAVRSTASRLGEERLRRLVAFYGSADAKPYEELSKRDPSSLSATEKATWDRILAKYPLADYLTSEKQTFEQMMGPGGYVDTLSKCDPAFDAELAKRGLRAEP
jgi:hypothetical protein